MHELLGDQHMLIGKRSHLRRVGHGENLHLGAEPRKALTDGGSGGAAHAGVDLIEHERWRRTTGREHDLQREDYAGKLTA